MRAAGGGRPDGVFSQRRAKGHFLCQLSDPRGAAIAAPGRIAIALDRLGSTVQLAKAPADRPADPAALQVAMTILISQVEAILDRKLRTNSLLGQNGAGTGVPRAGNAG